MQEGKDRIERERRGEEINVTEWVEDGDMRRTVELHARRLDLCC
jgi:hypothetical protein